MPIGLYLIAGGILLEPISTNYWGGVSLTLGVEYKKFNNLDKEFFNFEIASSLRAEENQDLPINSTLGKKKNFFYL